MSTGRYLKHAQARPQFHKSGHVTVVKKPYPYASYPGPGQGGTDRYTSTPKPGSFPPTTTTAGRADSQQPLLFASSRDSNNWTTTTTQRRELSRSDSNGRHDNGGSYSPDSVFTVSSGSSRSYHGGGGGGGFLGSSGEVFQEDGPSMMSRPGMTVSRSMLDVRDDLFSDEASSSTGVPGYQRSTSFLGTGSDDIHQGEFVKVKVGDFKDGAGAGAGGGGGGMTRSKFKSESNLLELMEAEVTSQRGNERRYSVLFVLYFVRSFTYCHPFQWRS